MPSSKSDLSGNDGIDNVVFDHSETLKKEHEDVSVKFPKMEEKETSVQNNALLKVKNGLEVREEEDKPRVLSLREGMKEKEYRARFFHSLTLAFSFLTLGFQVGQRGPSFLDIQLITGTDIEKASTFFTAGSVGYLCGSLVSGILIDKFNKVLLLTICVGGLAVTCAVVPLCSVYGVMVTIFLANSFCGGFLDTGGNADLVSIWGEAEGRPYMQFIHFAFAFGGVLSPLITAPFLTPSAPTEALNKNTTDIDNATSSSPAIAMIGNNLTSNANFTSNVSEDVGEIRLIYAYVISGILTFFAALGFLIIYCKMKASKNKQKKEKPVEEKRDLPLKYYILTVVLLDFMYLFYCSVEDTFAAYLLTFTVLHLKWSKSSGSQITSLFWASFAVSRFLGIFFIGCLRPVTMLFICLLALFFSLTAFLLCAYFYISPGIWVFAVFVGFSLSVIFPTGFTWTQESLVKVSGKVASSILIAASAGTMINPLIIGYLMEEVHPMWYVYLMISQSFVTIVLFLILLYISKFVLVKVRIRESREIEIPVSS